jgi:hypothetical protein
MKEGLVERLKKEEIYSNGKEAAKKGNINKKKVRGWRGLGGGVGWASGSQSSCFGHKNVLHKSCHFFYSMLTSATFTAPTSVTRISP